jgi:hypothetical protein
VRTQHPAKPHQASALTRTDHHPLAQLTAQDLVFDPQVLDLPDQLALDGFAHELK